jgi:hypothetical protein
MLNPLLRFDPKSWEFRMKVNQNVKFELRGPHFILASYIYLETPEIFFRVLRFYTSVGWVSCTNPMHRLLLLLVSITNHNIKDMRASPPTLIRMWPPALEILDEVHQSNPVNPLEDCWDPENTTESNCISDWRDSLIGPSGLLLLVSHGGILCCSFISDAQRTFEVL